MGVRAATGHRLLLELLRKAYGGSGRSAWFERILGLATPAFAMAQDEIHGPGIGNKGDNAHAGAAGAKEGIRLED